MTTKLKSLIKKETSKKRRLYVSYTQREEITRERDPEDKWDAEDTYIDVTFNNAFIAYDGDTAGRSRDSVTSYYEENGYKDHYFREMDFDWNVDLKEVYIVYVRYSDGDTFHREDGKWQVIGVFSNGRVADNWIRKNQSLVEKDFSGWFQHFDGLRSDVVPFNNYTI